MLHVSFHVSFLLHNDFYVYLDTIHSISVKLKKLIDSGIFKFNIKVQLYYNNTSLFNNKKGTEHYLLSSMAIT